MLVRTTCSSYQLCGCRMLQSCLHFFRSTSPRDRRILSRAFLRWRGIINNIKNLISFLLYESEKDVCALREQVKSMCEVVLAPPAVECCICYDRLCDGLLMPCSHMNTCMQCAIKCVECPICRESVHHVIKVYV